MLQTYFHPFMLIGPSHFKPRPLPCGPILLYAAVFDSCLSLPSSVSSSLFSLVHVVSSLHSVPPSLFCLSSGPPVSSLFLPSGDAAKRKAWKLNRVGSLRSIYTNSLHNSEGKNTAVTDRWTPIDPTLTPASEGVEHPVLEKCASPSKH